MNLIGDYPCQFFHVWAWSGSDTNTENEPAPETRCCCGQVAWKDREPRREQWIREPTPAGTKGENKG